MGGGSHFTVLLDAALDDDQAWVPVCGIAKVLKSIEHRYIRLWESMESRLALISGVEKNKI